jgi:hypothetical protein
MSGLGFGASPLGDAVSSDGPSAFPADEAGPASDVAGSPVPVASGASSDPIFGGEVGSSLRSGIGESVMGSR